MATITTLQVESVGISENDLTWIDVNPTQVPTVNRAPFGGAYTALTSTLQAGTNSFKDLTAVTGTRYQYKVTQLAGDSNIVDVVTQICIFASGAGKGQQTYVDFPIAPLSDPITAEQLHTVVDQLNRTLEGTNNPATPCTVCVVNGSIVLDCSFCTNFRVLAPANINSISMIGCNKVGNIDFVIPANTTTCISGWPSGLGPDSGQTCLTGGPNGTTYSVPFRNKGSSIPGVLPVVAPSSGGGGGAGCNCVPTSGNVLTLTCCSANCSMNCTKSGPGNFSVSTQAKQLRMIACGGVPPYTWSSTVGTLSSTGGSEVTLTPPANAGSSVTGTAYVKCGCCGNAVVDLFYGCDDVETGGGSGTTCGGCTGSTKASPSNDPPCGVDSGTPCTGYVKVTSTIAYGNPTNTVTDAARQATGACDQRTAGMIAAGCNPCGISMSGGIVTVTDKVGTSVSKTLAV